MPDDSRQGVTSGGAGLCALSVPPCWTFVPAGKRFTIVDATDAPPPGEKWRPIRGGRYVGTGGSKSVVAIHRRIMGLSKGDGKFVDHINGDRFDNRRQNLRVITVAENAQNRVCSGGSSQYRGVYRFRNVWRAKVNGKHLGLFDDELEAARVAAAYRREHVPFANEARHPVPTPTEER